MANTKLLLLEDVDSLGRSGDIVEVKPGFARNFLVPKGRALPATKVALRRQAQLQEERAKQAARDKAEAEAQAKKLEEVVLSIHVKVDPEGHMYGSVSAQDVVRLVEEQTSLQVDKRHVALEHTLKTTGVHKVPFKLPEGVEAEVSLKVIPETEVATEVVAEIEEVTEKQPTEEGGEAE